MFSPHPSMVENQFTHAPPPLPVHIGIPGYTNHQGPALRMGNAAYGAYPFPYYYPMPPVQPPPNPVCTLSTLTHIPLLNSHLDFTPWDSGIQSVLHSLGLIGHIAVTSDPIDPLCPETMPSSSQPDTGLRSSSINGLPPMDYEVSLMVLQSTMHWWLCHAIPITFKNLLSSGELGLLATWVPIPYF